MHILAIKMLNQMGGKIDFNGAFGFLLELHGVEEPEILYHVMLAVLEGHDTNQS